MKTFEAFYTALRKAIKWFLPYGIVQWVMGKNNPQPWGDEFFLQLFTSKAQDLADGRFQCRWKDRWPCLDDATSNTGFDAHYIYHCAWAARKIAENFKKITNDDGARHVDISSSLHFVTMLSAFVPVDFYDYRPAALTLSSLRCNRADLLSLPFSDGSIQSLSCMHVVEHIGLERYGDPFDPQGDLKAMRELQRVLAPNGHLFFVVPVGNEARIQYNAHRIYTYNQILACFEKLQLHSFAFVDDSGKFTPAACVEDIRDSKYGCGCFEFVKL